MTLQTSQTRKEVKSGKKKKKLSFMRLYEVLILFFFIFWGPKSLMNPQNFSKNLTKSEKILRVFFTE